MRCHWKYLYLYIHVPSTDCTQLTHIYLWHAISFHQSGRRLGALLFCTATLWFRLIGCMYVCFTETYSTLCTFKTNASNWKRLWGHLTESLNALSNSVDLHHWCMHACCGNLFNSAHVLHITQNTWTCKYNIWKCKLAMKLGICSLIQEYIALLSKRSDACAGDDQTVSIMLCNFLQ